MGIALWTVQALWTCACVHGVRVVVLLLCDEIRRHICAQSSFIIHNTSGMRMRVVRFPGLGIRVYRRRLLRTRAPAAVASTTRLSASLGSWYRPGSWFRRLAAGLSSRRSASHTFPLRTRLPPSRARCTPGYLPRRAACPRLWPVRPAPCACRWRCSPSACGPRSKD